MIPHVLSIAGSDPSGGAGIQADLKTFSALGAYGMAGVTALTAQNTQGVSGIHHVPPEFIRDQIDSVFADIRVDAVKIGMAGSAQSVAAIAAALKEHKARNIVIDPVMAAASGDRLADDETIEAIKAEFLPLAGILTPNIPEAEILLDRKYGGDMEDFARSLLALGPRAILLKGGHLEGAQSNDCYADSRQSVILEGKRIKTGNTHGTGCTLSSALAVFFARGLTEPEAARAAKDYLAGALENAGGLAIGHGAGPVHHFYKAWRDE